MNQLTTLNFDENFIPPTPAGCRTCGLMGHDLEL